MAATRDGPEAEEFRQRRDFLGLTSADADLLRSLRPIFAQHAATFADRFYQHLLADAHTARLIRDPEQLNRLKTLQAEYFAELLAGVFDEAYLARRERVGQAHQRVGLEPQWYLGAYNQYIQITFPIFVQAFNENLSAALPALLALVKVVFLDIGLALDTYFHAALLQVQQRNDELQQALELYGQAHRREEELRRVASHEIRGGLAAIITNLEDLRDRAESAPSAETTRELANELSQVKDRCWALTSLLKQMLSEAARPGGAQWVETGTLFAELRSRFALYAQGRNIELRLPEVSPRVWADAAQLREVFANLIANSVRYIECEPGLVEVNWEPQGNQVRFRVRDNGPGLPPEVRERLFEPFVRGRNAASRAGGSGLGLYFVRSLVEQNGGAIGVEPEDGLGAEFWFTVPTEPTATRPG